MRKSSYDFETEVAIIGAGPAGSSISILLGQKRIKHTVFEKMQFPRDKICGDGLSGKVISLLKQIDTSIIVDLENERSKIQPSWGVRFVSPNGTAVDIPFYLDHQKNEHPPGFVARRLDFDSLLLKRINPSYADLYQGTEVTNLEYVEDGLLLQLKKEEKELTCRAKMIIGAEGIRSIVAKKLAHHKILPEHSFTGLRAYYENVSDMHRENYIELHFVQDLLPGYFWIFPLPDNKANVGLGLLTKRIHQKHLHLKRIFQKIIAENDYIKERFKNARMIDEIRGWGLPLGSIKRRLSGDRFLLAGDAGSLIDPFTGEGIGNALLSARYAADMIEKAVNSNNYSEEFLRKYDQMLYSNLWSELKVSKAIQRLVSLPWLFNFVFKRLHNNKTLQETFSAMLNDIDMRTKLRSPAFYFQLLFNLK